MKYKYLLFPLIGIALIAGGCDTSGSSGQTQNQESAVTESNQQKLLQDVPIPQLDHSIERKNLAERLTRFNTTDKVSYIYLINYGKVMAFYTVKGKVSSVNSLLTTPQQIIQKCDGAAACERYVVDSPDIDGSYGSNGDAIFFFDTANNYIEWKGDYMLSDSPLKLTQQPELIQNITK